MKSDIIVDLVYGDSGKGKVSKYLSSINKYTHCLRFNGGPNAGHTVYLDGKKFVTHQIPCGIFHGMTCVIGATCVIDVKSLFEEIGMLEQNGIEVRSKLRIAKNAHIITYENLREDDKDVKVGTTKKGIGPCYAAKANRIGERASDAEELKPFLIDLYDEFFLSGKEPYILCEGAQGFYLDIDWGDYPYVTSSVCTVAGVFQNCVPFDSVNKVYGVAKAYDTYVGAKQFEPDSVFFKRLREIGNEFGATTGRPRQCNWINLHNLVRAINFNSVTDLVINKCDILEELSKEYPIGMYDMRNGQVVYFETIDEWKDAVTAVVKRSTKVKEISFSSSKDVI